MNIFKYLIYGVITMILSYCTFMFLGSVVFVQVDNILLTLIQTMILSAVISICTALIIDAIKKR